MRHLSKILIAVILAVLTAMTLPAQVFAAGTEEKYISEVQIGVGKSASEAEKMLEGYEILKDDKGNKVDLNKNAGATGIGGKGNRVVYLGFKRTGLKSEAITDLAVMNMKGGYSVEDYDALMESNIKEQIMPFVDGFLATITEYRINYDSKIEKNRLRARYIHDVLNKLIDDDTGKGLGDLLLNKTKFEMNEKAYNDLSDAQKKEHADIVTIIAQANGQAVLALENLLTRAADTNDSTWLDRLASTTYDGLLDETELPPAKAAKQLDREYSDIALTILGMWDAFKENLENYENALAILEKCKNKDLSEQEAIINSYDIEKATDEETEAYAKAMAEISTNTELMSNAYADVVCKEYLETVKYDGGTLLDYFTRDSKEIEEDITVLYPLVAALTKGQSAGLEFITLQEMVIIAATDEKGYKDASFDDFEEVSIYDGVDRGIYEKGGVGLTSDAYRQNAMQTAAENSSNGLSLWTYASIGLTAASVIAFGITAGVKISTSSAIKAYSTKIADLEAPVAKILNSIKGMKIQIESVTQHGGNVIPYQNHLNKLYNEFPAAEQELKAAENPKYLERLQARSGMCNRLMLGIGIAMIILIGITTYLTYQDMVNRYKVDFTPIPRYMVDEDDITAYNAKGEKVVIKNQAAYYKAALCNRTGGDYYGTVGNIGDLNGYVGQQWLALYAERNEMKAPVLADSLKFTSSAEIPAGYTTGIHSFGTEAAENLNNTLYVWESTAPGVYVYFKTEEPASASTAGSNFTAGTVALTGVAGLALGVLAAALCLKVTKKRKDNKAVEA